jgi:hypothetical protein
MWIDCFSDSRQSRTTELNALSNCVSKVSAVQFRTVLYFDLYHIVFYHCACPCMCLLVCLPVSVYLYVCIWVRGRRIISHCTTTREDFSYLSPFWWSKAVLYGGKRDKDYLANALEDLITGFTERYVRAYALALHRHMHPPDPGYYIETLLLIFIIILIPPLSSLFLLLFLLASSLTLNIALW